MAAVVSRSDREPILEACAASFAAPVAGACFASGVLEVAWVLGCEKERHIAALSASLCTVEPQPSDAFEVGHPPPVSERLREGAIVGGDGLRVLARESVVEEAASLFVRAGLKLLALDCEACAVASLAQVLGSKDEADARRQHLAAVAVTPDSEGAAEALGEDLAVPVGLAVAWFGATRAV